MFGYDNVEVPGPAGRRGHVVRVINPEQAAVVRRIFELYASGLGLKRIVRVLNAEHLAAPRGHGWAPTAIREILHRELYQGMIVWNRSQKIVKGGMKKQRTRPEHEWLRLDAPELRVVSDAVWAAVQRRLAQTGRSLPRMEDGRLVAVARRETRPDGASPYLLTGFARCGQCGGSFGGMTQLHGTGPAAHRKRVRHYGCSFHRQRGEHVCANGVTIKTEIIDHALLDALAELLQARAVNIAVERAIERLRAGRDIQLDRRVQIERELSLTDSKLRRLANAIAGADDAPVETLVATMRAEEQRKKGLVVELATLSANRSTMPLDPDRVKRLVQERSSDLRGLLARTPDDVRRMLAQIFPRKLAAHPVEDEHGRRGYRLVGDVNVAGLLPPDIADALPTIALDEQPVGGGPNGN